MRIRTQCRACGLPFRARLDAAQSELACPGCEETRTLDPQVWDPGPPGRVGPCPACECEHLYAQKDVNRVWGCALVIVGAALVPWTYGLSLILLSGLDLVLYYRLPKAVVCYRCDTLYRDARPGPRQGEFDLLKHDVVKYGKTWELVDGEGRKIAPEM